MQPNNSLLNPPQPINDSQDQSPEYIRNSTGQIKVSFDLEKKIYKV